MNDKELYTECHKRFSYDAKTGLLTRKISTSVRAKAGSIVAGMTGHGYVQVYSKGDNYLVHRIAWLMVFECLPSKFLDHINGDRTDNRIDNLREATNSENCQNRGKNKNNTTGFKGVFPRKGSLINPYRAKICSNGKSISLGKFPTAESAHEAYCQAVKKNHGEFGRAV